MVFRASREAGFRSGDPPVTSEKGDFLARVAY